MRQTTLDKEKAILKIFHRLLRSGKDYTTKYMHEEAGRECFLTGESAGQIVRKYYRKTITPEMKQYFNGLNGESHDKKIDMFRCKFRLCKRESRLIIYFIKRSKS